MKIVHVIDDYFSENIGGTQVHLRDLCRAQLALGCRVHVFSRHAGSERPEYHLSRDDRKGIPVTRITNNFLVGDRFDRLFSNPEIDAVFGGFLDREEPEVVHFHHLSGLSISMIEVAKKRGCHTVLTLHDYWLQCPRGQRFFPDDLSICETIDRTKCLGCLRKLVPHLLPPSEPRGWLRRWVSGDASLAKILSWETDVRRWIGLCDLIIAPSKFHLEHFFEAGLPDGRCVTLPHGLPTSHLISEPRGRRPVQRLGYIGTLLPSKGIHVLMEAFNELRRTDLALDIHGVCDRSCKEKGYLEELRALIRPGMSVRFHGRYEPCDLPEILATLDLLVVPSLWWESFGLTVREGVLAGIPVIVSKLGGLVEAVDEGLALGVEAGDPHKLAAAIDRVCHDEELRDTMSRRADRVRDVTSYAGELASLYSALA